MIKGQYSYVCDLCGAIKRDSFTVGPALERPCPPEDWVVIGERLICDAHDLSKITLAEVLGMSAPNSDQQEFDGQATKVVSEALALMGVVDLDGEVFGISPLQTGELVRKVIQHDPFLTVQQAYLDVRKVCRCSRVIVPDYDQVAPHVYVKQPVAVEG